MSDVLLCPRCDREVFQPGEDGLYEEGTEVVCACGTKCHIVVDEAEGDADEAVAYVEVVEPRPEWTSADGALRLYRGDCAEVMRAMPEASVDAIVCDPPYALTGASRRGSQRANDPATPFGRHRLQSKAGGGFMGQKWDSELPPVETWAEALRVAKPGAHLLAFGGTRTYHRLVCNIEDAGWEIRDAFCWLYGQGMPKSLDVSKAIDREAGAEREIVGANPTWREAKRTQKIMNPVRGGSAEVLTVPTTPAAREWSGWGTGLKPSVEFIVLARKPLCGTVAKNVQQHGTGGINIDACRIPRGDKTPFPVGAESPDGVIKTGLHSKPRGDDANPSGGWPGNVVLSHHPDCVLVGTRKVKAIKGTNSGRGAGRTSEDSTYGKAAWGKGRTDMEPGAPIGYADADGMETVEVWECEPDCPVRMLDEQSGERKAGGGILPGKHTDIGYSGGMEHRSAWAGYGDGGGASRFFYTAKASRSERDDGLDELPLQDSQKWNPGGIHARRAAEGKGRSRNTHCTVKPVALMDYLVKLVTPPGGLVLDPFVGSGTTMVACAKLGVRCTGIDLDPSYARIAVARVRRAREKVGTLAASEAQTGQQIGLLANVPPPREEPTDG